MGALSAIRAEMRSGELGMEPLGKGKYAGLAGIAAGAAVEYGAGYAIGRGYAQHGWKWLPRAAAIAGKLGAVGLQMAGAPGLLVGAVGGAGSAGVAILGLEHGLIAGRKAKGIQVVQRPAGAALQPGDVPVDSIGARGRRLTYDQIEQYAKGF